MSGSPVEGCRISNVEVWDPFQGRHWTGDVFVHQGRWIDPAAITTRNAWEEVPGRGLWLVPRIIDVHTHLREPGEEWREDLTYGLWAAVHGGMTGVAAMANVDPAWDQASGIEWACLKAEQIAAARLYPVGAVSSGLKGQDLAPLALMRQAGARAFSDDPYTLRSAALMRSALTYARGLDATVIASALDADLGGDGVMHEGVVAAGMGLPGQPEVAEAAVVWRDVLLADFVGAALHVAHVSSVGAVEAISWARARGARVSGEATPQHLFYTDARVADTGYHPSTKMAPPLRPEATRDALRQAVRQGILEVLASDHQPLHADDRDTDYVAAPFGMSGLETALAASFTALVAAGDMAPLDFWHRWTVGPHGVLGLKYQGMMVGEVADCTLIDPQVDWVVDSADFFSKGKNTPFQGEHLKGRAIATMVGGSWKMRDGEVIR